MQHVDNDMNDLFKRAAEDYPLQAGSGDWESIAKKIADKSDEDVVPVIKNNNNKNNNKAFELGVLPTFIDS